MSRAVTLSVVRGTPRWGQRGMQAIYDFNEAAIVYMMPEQVEVNDDELKKDWRLRIMVAIVEMIQNGPSSFIPLIAPFEQTSANGPILVPQLSDVLSAKKEDLPLFYLIHPMSQ